MLVDHWWASDLYAAGGVTLLAAWLIWGILSVTLHELAHGWVAVGLGDQTPIHTGHMTWNPVVHMGTRGLMMLLIIGLPSGAMPVDPTRMRGQYADAKVSIAGPLTNLALSLVSIIVGGVIAALNAGIGPMLTMHPATTLEKLQLFFFLGSSLNIALALFNLLPCPPLDGSRIVANFSGRYREFVATPGGQALSVGVYVLGFLFAGQVVFDVGGSVTIHATRALGGALHALGVGR
jgi:Zn-dependent protease